LIEGFLKILGFQNKDIKLSKLQNYQILVISLERSLERRKKIINEFSKYDLSWSFLNAIDGRKLKFPVVGYSAKKNKRLVGYELSNGEIACFLSHKMAWKKCVSENKPTIIMEDDIELSDEFIKVIDTLILNQLEWDLVRLQGILQLPYKFVKKIGNYNFVEHIGDPLGSMAYIINPNAGVQLLENSKEIYVVSDWYLKLEKKHKIKMLELNPYCLKIRNIDSEIGERGGNIEDLNIKTYIKSKFRGLNQRLDRILSKNPWFPN